MLYSKNYQTIILFFLWTIGLISTIVRLFVGERLELTPIILAIAIIDMVFSINRKNWIVNHFSYNITVIIIIFYGWIIFTNLYSPSQNYKFDKTISFIANVVFFLYPFFIKRINVNLLIKLYCTFILPLSAYYVYMNSIVWSVKSAQTALFMDIRGAYLIFGIHLGILFLMLLHQNKNILLKIITFSLLIASGARGPLIFMILAIIFYYINKGKKININPKIISKSILALTGVIGIYFFKKNTIDSLLENSLARFGSLVGGEDGSAIERVHRLNFAFNQPFEKLSTFFFGNGIGSFGIIFEKIDHRSYPHNILLECFFELGFIGLIIFLILFITVLKKLSLKSNVFGLLFVFIFLNAMKSSNITDLWILFGTIGGIASINMEDTNDSNYNPKLPN